MRPKTKEARADLESALRDAVLHLGASYQAVGFTIGRWARPDSDIMDERNDDVLTNDAERMRAAAACIRRLIAARHPAERGKDGG